MVVRARDVDILGCNHVHGSARCGGFHQGVATHGERGGTQGCLIGKLHPRESLAIRPGKPHVRCLPLAVPQRVLPVEQQIGTATNSNIATRETFTRLAGIIHLQSPPAHGDKVIICIVAIADGTTRREVFSPGGGRRFRVKLRV